MVKLIVFTVIIIPAFIFASDGFGGNATGGTWGETITVTNAEEFTTYAGSLLPYTITIPDTIVLNGNLIIASNKTIQGADTSAAIIGNLIIGNGVRNVIIKNLNITNPNGVGEGDGITISGGRNVFISHCTFTDCADGSIDIIRQADSVTISWCRFQYINQTSHNFVNLIGNNDSFISDLGYLHVTIHHCWYADGCVERMPSVRFGRVHVYNNYYNTGGAQYCVRTRLYAECLVENNFFENVRNPWELFTTSGTTGKLYAANNNVSFLDPSFNIVWESGGSGQSLIPGSDTVFTPPYSYFLDGAEEIKDTIMISAGNTAIINPVDVNENPGNIIDFALFQNYPNPFNPSTKFSFAIPERSFVSLKVYNLLGKEIAAIVSEELSAGNYKRIWNAENISSGVYFYRLQAGNFTETKKLILVK